MENKKQSAKTMLFKFSQILKSNKKLEYAVYAVIVVLILALYATSLSGGKEEAPSVIAQETLTSERDVENRLEEALSAIRGAGRVEVMITYETGTELVTAMSTDTSVNRSETSGDGKQSSTEQETQSQKPATVSNSGGSTPIVLTEKQPEVRGVIVIAEGASDLMVRMNLQKAVQTVLNVPVSCIEVFEREHDENK